MNDYNQKRLHSTIDYQTPNEVYFQAINNSNPKGDKGFNLCLALNSFLESTGRTVHDLGLTDINSSTNEMKFGAFSFGNNDGVNGEFKLLTFKLKQNEVSIVKQICMDKNAQKIHCYIRIYNKLVLIKIMVERLIPFNIVKIKQGNL